MIAARFPIPVCYADQAFMRCVDGCFETPELMKNFDRLYGASLTTNRSPIEMMVDKATGKQESDMKAFVQFVYDCIYTRLPDEAIHSLRQPAKAV